MYVRAWEDESSLKVWHQAAAPSPPTAVERTAAYVAIGSFGGNAFSAGANAVAAAGMGNAFVAVDEVNAFVSVALLANACAVVNAFSAEVNAFFVEVNAFAAVDEVNASFSAALLANACAEVNAFSAAVNAFFDEVNAFFVEVNAFFVEVNAFAAVHCWVNVFLGEVNSMVAAVAGAGEVTEFFAAGEVNADLAEVNAIPAEVFLVVANAVCTWRACAAKACAFRQWPSWRSPARETAAKAATGKDLTAAIPSSFLIGYLRC